MLLLKMSPFSSPLLISPSPPFGLHHTTLLVHGVFIYALYPITSSFLSSHSHPTHFLDTQQSSPQNRLIR